MYFLAILLLAFGAFNVVQSEECKQALGMESRAITDGQISASSQFSSRNAATKARLNYQGTPGAWSPAANDKRPWLQIDLRSHVTKVTRVATQGRRDSYQWVTKYQLQYSSDGEKFVNYKEKGDTEATSFPGNTDRTTVVHHDLNPPIRARYIRFLPVARRSWPSMRVELYGCKEKFQCPVCHAIGQNAEATCDKNVKYETCNRHNAVCQVSKKATTDDKTLEVTRKCSDTQAFRDENEKCKQDSNCLYTAYCLDSMCMASAPEGGDSGHQNEAASPSEEGIRMDFESTA
ncbi:retinoschisin-like [Montipora foliosa]|uniref:retinoschisin-like n=1 Tax=Montipora foliosa TaxID=591990 RepID=UPI0035F10DD9